MKKHQKIVSLCCAGLMLFSMIGCNNQETEGLVEIEKTSSVAGARHDIFVKESNYDFIKNGVSDYTIVYPYSQTPDTTIVFAVNELKNFIKEATGVTLNAYDDHTYTGKEKILSIPAVL